MRLVKGMMEGWLYLIRSNHFGMNDLRRRYFILDENCLRIFKSQPASDKEEPVRCAMLDSCIHILDNGKGRHRGKVIFTFTLLNTFNHNDQLRLGATSSEEAVQWIRSLQDAAFNPAASLSNCLNRRCQSKMRMTSKFRCVFPISTLSCVKRCNNDLSSTSSMYIDAMTSDVVTPSRWKIFGYRNGLRLFQESKDIDSNSRHPDKHRAILAVGVVDGNPEAVFRTLMSLSTSRAQWDFCFNEGRVLERVDDHTDIIHMELNNHWLPWAMKRRDMLLRRYWRREDSGTYVILYHSVVNRKCPPQKGYVRACLKCGGYVLTPINQGRETVIKHMLAVDWKFKSYRRKSVSRFISVRMVGRVAALREMFRAKAGNTGSDFLSEERTAYREIAARQQEENELVGLKMTQNNREEQLCEHRLSRVSSLNSLNDAADEFFDVPEISDYEMIETGQSSRTSPQSCYSDKYQSRLPSPANFVKKLQLAVQKRGYMDLQEISQRETILCSYGYTLPQDTTCSMLCSCTESDASAYLIRGHSYLEDHKKITAKNTLMQMVGADWLRSDIREDDLAGRNGSIVQHYAADGRPEFFFIVNIQVPGTVTHSLALYYMLKTPLSEIPLLDHFVNGDDAFRNSRFKLIPHISKGAWIVKQTVGRKACLIGNALQINYFRGKNYLELGIDIGSSAVARGVVSLVLGYLSNLVIEMAFLIQGNTIDELPESLLGTCRLNHLDASEAVSVDSIQFAVDRNDIDSTVCKRRG